MLSKLLVNITHTYYPFNNYAAYYILTYSWLSALLSCGLGLYLNTLRVLNSQYLSKKSRKGRFLGPLDSLNHCLSLFKRPKYGLS
jgi:hypothetical protein